MSKDTAIATGDTATAVLRDPHVRRVVDVARNSPQLHHAPKLLRRVVPFADVGQERRSQPHSNGIGDGGGVLGQVG